MQQPNTILALLDPFFALISELDSKHSSLDQEVKPHEFWRKKMHDLFILFERQAQENRIDPQKVCKTKYALVAFIDEYMIHYSKIAPQWVNNPLQLTFFGENSAGIRFFKLLEKMRLQAEQWIDVIEIYYLCLEIGFEGQYRLHDKFQLLALKKELLSQIQHIRKLPDCTLYLSAVETLQPLPLKAKYSFKILTFVVFLLMSGFYLSYYIMLDLKAGINEKIIMQLIQK